MDIITELQANNIAVSSLNIILNRFRKTLAATKDITNAQKLYDSVPPSDDYRYIRTGMYLASRAGNSEQAQTLFDKLKARGERRQTRHKRLATFICCRKACSRSSPSV
jgi:hypothetical protein